jgi:hypothetical protein
MATFRSNEPRARGIPAGRYKRPINRTNALVQDSNCIDAPPAPILFEGQLAWEDRTTGTFAATNAGLIDRTSNAGPIVIEFAVLNVINFTGVTVSSARVGMATGAGAGPVIAYNALTGLGTVTFAADTSYTAGTLNLTLNNLGVPVGQIVLAMVADGVDGYANVQWLAYTAL